MKSLVRTAIFVCVTLLLVPPAPAQEPPSAPAQAPPAQQLPVVRLTDLIDELVRRNPKARAAQFRFEAASKRPSQVSTLPDPRIRAANFGVGHPFSTLDVSNFAYQSIGVSQEVPFPGKLALAGKEAQKEAESEEQNARAVLLEVLSRLKLAYYEWFYLTKAIQVTEKNQELMQRFERIARARYTVGKGIQQDVLKAQVELSGLAQQLELLQQRRASIEAQINALLNRAPETPLGVPADMKRSPFELDLNTVLQSVQQQSPRLLSRARVVDSRSAGLERARKEKFPDFNFSFDWQKNAARFRDYYMTTAEVRVPLYFWRKQRLGIQEANARLEEARQDQQATLQDLLFMAKDQYLVAKTSERLLALYESGIIPQALLSLESAMAGYEVGNVDFLTLINNVTTLLNFETQYYEELAKHEQALARLEPLLARELTH